MRLLRKDHGVTIFLIVLLSNAGMAQKTSHGNNSLFTDNVPDYSVGAWEKLDPENLHSFVADRKGNIYGLTGNHFGPTKVCKLIDDKWVEIPIEIDAEPKINYVYKIWLTKKGDLIAECLYVHFYKLTDAGWQKITDEVQSEKYSSNEKEDWSNIPPPPGHLTMGKFPRLNYPLGKFFLRGRHKDNADNLLIYEYRGAKWTLILSFSEKAAGSSIAKGFDYGRAIVLNDKVYMMEMPEGPTWNLAVFNNKVNTIASKTNAKEPAPVPKTLTQPVAQTESPKKNSVKLSSEIKSPQTKAVAQLNLPKNNKRPNNQPTISGEKADYTIVYDTINKGWKYFGSDDVGSSHLIANKRGEIFCFRSTKNQIRRIHKLVNDTWIDIHGDMEDGYQIRLTKNDILTMECQQNNNGIPYYFLAETGWKRTDEKIITEEHKGEDGWNNIPPPPKFLNGSVWEWEFHRLEYPPGRFIVAGGQKHFRDSLIILEYIDNGWKPIGGLSEKAAGSFIFKLYNLVVSKNKIYMLAPDTMATEKGKLHLAVLENNPVVTSRKSYSIKPIPGNGGNSVDKTIGIFEVNGKKGLRNLKGEIIVYPIFDSITLTIGKSTRLSEDNNCDVAYHLVNKDVNFFVKACYNTPSPDRLYGFVKSVTICTTCNGTGKYKNDTSRVKLREWVPEKTTDAGTSYRWNRVWNSSTNTYDNVRSTVTSTKTKEGYYKDAGYKEVVTPGATCSQCINGIESTTSQTLEYNESSENYYLKTTVTPRIKKPWKAPLSFREKYMNNKK